MPSLQIPESGLSFEAFSGKSTKTGSPTQDIIGLTLTDGMIEEMIKCVQNGKPIQLSLGQHPNLSFGTTTQQLSQYQDPFAHELYQYESSNSHSSSSPCIMPIGKPNTSFQRAMNPNYKPSKPTSSISQATTPNVKAVTAGADAARDALEKSLAEEKARKKGNTTQLLKATLDPKRGPLKASGTSKFLAAQDRDSNRSVPSSPALSGTGSPSIAPTSVPASQVAAEQAKATRKPIIHILALGPLSEKDLKEKLMYADLDGNLFEAALNKVADKDDSTKLFTLRQKNWKDLDVWCFNYDTEEDRQAVIDAAVKIYDRMRLQPNDDEWERLKPLETRGNGISLSKLQAKIAQGPIARTPRLDADSGLDTPAREGEEATNKVINRVKKETKPRSPAQAPAAKAKKVSEKEAPARILANKKKPAAAAVRKELPSKAGGAKPLSSQYVNSESEEDARAIKKAQPAKPAAAKPGPVVKAKRAREDEGTSDASLTKKARVSGVARELKDKPAALPSKPKRAREEETVAAAGEYSQPIKKKARPSDASQHSVVKSKGTSPQKSSPLASSPPTNASEFNSSSSDSSTPRHLQNHTLAHKRNTSSASSTTSSTNRVSAHILHMAAEYKVFHIPYLKLYQSLSLVEERDRDPEKWADLMEMHKRLAAMKREIYNSSPTS